MPRDSGHDPLDQLVDELRNFQEIARYLNPSSGEIPHLPGIDICDLSMPMREVIGGDHTIYIDFNRRYDLDTRIAEAERGGRDNVADQLRQLRLRAGILLADASGHRMTDALIGAMLHQAFLVGVIYELDLFGHITTRLFEHINTRFYKTTAFNKYFTMIYGEISVDGKFRFLSAGHQPPLVFSREFGRFADISSDRLVSFLPVGMFASSSDPDNRVDPSTHTADSSYAINEIDLLASGDVLLLITDGIADHGKGRYFPGALEEFMQGMRDETAETICERLREHILEFAEPDDDISAVVIRRTG